MKITLDNFETLINDMQTLNNRDLINEILDGLTVACQSNAPEMKELKENIYDYLIPTTIHAITQQIENLFYHYPPLTINAFEKIKTAASNLNILATLAEKHRLALGVDAATISLHYNPLKTALTTLEDTANFNIVRNEVDDTVQAAKDGNKAKVIIPSKQHVSRLLELDIDEAGKVISVLTEEDYETNPFAQDLLEKVTKSTVDLATTGQKINIFSPEHAEQILAELFNSNDNFDQNCFDFINIHVNKDDLSYDHFISAVTDSTIELAQNKHKHTYNITVYNADHAEEIINRGKQELVTSAIAATDARSIKLLEDATKHLADLAIQIAENNDDKVTVYSPQMAEEIVKNDKDHYVSKAVEAGSVSSKYLVDAAVKLNKISDEFSYKDYGSIANGDKGTRGTIVTQFIKSFNGDLSTLSDDATRKQVIKDVVKADSEEVTKLLNQAGKDIAVREAYKNYW